MDYLNDIYYIVVMDHYLEFLIIELNLKIDVMYWDLLTCFRIVFVSFRLLLW
jgi:hypothetical protein